MSFKEHLKSMFKHFFIITTLVNFAMFFLGSQFRAGMPLNYNALLYPPMYGFFGSIPELVIYSKKELPVKQMLVREIFQVLFLEVLLILLTFSSEYYVAENVGMIVSFAVSVLVIYILVIVISWIIDSKTANEMMKDINLLKEARGNG